jgi:hypothetical protein
MRLRVLLAAPVRSRSASRGGATMKRAIAAALAVSMLLSGCFGSFKALTGIWGFNHGVSTSKFVQELVFLGLVILPIYELASLGDVLIFNTIEFWSGTNPLASREVELQDGTVATLVREPDGVRVIHGGESFLLQQTEGGIRVLGSDGSRVAEVVAQGHRALVIDHTGRVVHEADGEEMQQRAAQLVP